ncbi:MAG: M48 family metalloprotease [Deltaproteobacteria bacterium]|nr:M48 family metalloprotease [Deltaproteobacteria bacterium]
MAWPAKREFLEASARAAVWQSGLATAALLGLLASIVVLAGWLIAGTAGAVVLAGLGVVLAATGGSFGEAYVLRAVRAQPLGYGQAPLVHDLVGALSVRAGVAAPRIFLAPSWQPNAATLGRDPERATLVVTAGLLGRLDARGLAGVLAHEIAHIRHRDLALASVSGSMVSLLLGISRLGNVALLLFLPVLLLAGPKIFFGALLLVIGLPFAALMVQAAMSRQREFAADATAARLTGDPAGLAEALAEVAVERPTLLELFFGRGRPAAEGHPLRTHPPTPERVERLLRMAEVGTASGGTGSSRRPFLSFPAVHGQRVDAAARTRPGQQSAIRVPRRDESGSPGVPRRESAGSR